MKKKATLIDEAKAVSNHYDENPQKEWDRMEIHPMEFELTKAMLLKFLKPGSVLDIGGGPGRYSLWLASLGYDVTLVDISPNNVSFAKQKAQESGLRIKTLVADARDLSELKGQAYDNVLLMGPLYHLFEESSRVKAVQEAKALLKPDGIFASSFITTACCFNFYYDLDPALLPYDAALDALDRLHDHEPWSGKGFTEVHFVDQDQVEPFMLGQGFSKLSLFGQEGIIAPRQTAIETASPEVFAFYLKECLRFCEDPRYFNFSCHLMFVGNKETR